MWRKRRDRVQAELQNEIDRLGALIGASGMQLAGFDPRIDAGYPYIAVGPHGELDLIVKERGKVLRHDRARDADEILFWAFESTTFSIASTWSAPRRPRPPHSALGQTGRTAVAAAPGMGPTLARRTRGPAT